MRQLVSGVFPGPPAQATSHHNSNVLTDADGNGHAALALGACGGDCDDARPSVYMGAEELCDGPDNDCDTKRRRDPAHLVRRLRRRVRSLARRRDAVVRATADLRHRLRHTDGDVDLHAADRNQQHRLRR